jgi:ribosome-associated toxin RatA of RatAB toxin-antitoxin module
MPSLDARTWRLLERGDVVTEARDTASGRRDAVAYGLFSAAPDDVFAAVTDYERYKDFMPFTTVSEVRRREDDTVWFYTELGFPLKTITYEIRVKLDAEQRKASWTLVRGDLKANDGSWHIEPYQAGSLATYSLHLVPGFPIPGFILKKLTRSSLPQLLNAVRTRLGETRYR